MPIEDNFASRFEWTDERIETLRKLWASGASASQIAVRMNCASRSAVCGKIHRLGLPERSRVTPWNVAKIAMLRALWADSAPYRRISDAIGLSIATIARKARELQLPPRTMSQPPNPTKGGKPPARNRTADFMEASQRGGSIAHRIKRRAEIGDGSEAVDLPPDQSPDAVRFLDRAGDTCRWPLNDVHPITAHMVCNTECPEGHSYCARHAEIAKGKPRARRENEATQHRPGNPDFRRRDDEDYRHTAWR